MSLYNPGADFTVTSGYPARPNGADHGGIDFAAPAGTFIPAAGNGTVVRSEYSPTLGWVVVIEHMLPEGTFFTRYSHQNGNDMPQVGDYVIRGEKIGEVGNTGASRGDHLHYDIPITPTSISKPDPKETRNPYTQKFPDGGPFDASTGDGGIAKNYPEFNVDKQKQKFDDAKRRQVDPLVFDLDGDGIETTSVKSGAVFDHEGNGFAEQTGWVGPDDGLLVWDRNGDGRINDGKELFGDSTLLKSGIKAADGFQALAEWDDNADGMIDSRDAVWANLKVWRDTDGDGYSLPSELLNLADIGIQSINTTYTLPGTSDGQGNIQTHLGSFTKTDGSTGQIADYLLQIDRTYSVAETWLDVPADIAALPEASGYGTVYGLRQAMVRDTTGSLKVLVQSLVAQTDVAQRNSTDAY